MRKNQKIDIRLTYGQACALAVMANEVFDASPFFHGIWPRKHDRETAERGVEVLSEQLKGMRDAS